MKHRIALVLLGSFAGVIGSGCASTGDARVSGYRPVFVEALDVHTSRTSHVPSIWPTTSSVTSVASFFGPRGKGRLHKGVDILAPQKAPVVAAADGIVSFSGQMRGFGQVIWVTHADGLETVYGHLCKREVKEGDQVVQGGVIGLVGMTGNATTPHIHYEVHSDGTPVDPLPYLPANEQMARSQD